MLSQCPTHFGRRNGHQETVEMLRHFKEGTAKVGSRQLAEQVDLIPRGVFVDEERPEYCDQYAEVIQRAQAARAGGAGGEEPQ